MVLNERDEKGSSFTYTNERTRTAGLITGDGTQGKGSALLMTEYTTRTARPFTEG